MAVTYIGAPDPGVRMETLVTPEDFARAERESALRAFEEAKGSVVATTSEKAAAYERVDPRDRMSIRDALDYDPGIRALADTVAMTSPVGAGATAGRVAGRVAGKVAPRALTRFNRWLSGWWTPAKATVGGFGRAIGGRMTGAADFLAGNWRRALEVERAASKASYAQKQVSRLAATVGKLKGEADALAGAAVKSVNGKTVAIVRSDLKARAAIKEAQAGVYARQLKKQQANLKDATKRVDGLRKRGIISKAEFQAQERALGVAQEVAVKHGVAAALKARLLPLTAEGLAAYGATEGYNWLTRDTRDATNKELAKSAKDLEYRKAQRKLSAFFADEDGRREAASDRAALEYRLAEIRKTGQDILSKIPAEQRDDPTEYRRVVRSVNERMADLIEGMRGTEAWNTAVEKRMTGRYYNEAKLSSRTPYEVKEKMKVIFPSDVEAAADMANQGTYFFPVPGDENDDEKKSEDDPGFDDF